MWPIRWLTGIIGFFQTYASVFAVSTPTRRDPISPGPTVTAIASMFGRWIVEDRRWLFEDGG
jgi:hypothetical protein